MQITDDWRERLARSYLPFATWITVALVAIVTGALFPLTGQTGAYMVLIAFLCASPAMISARLTIALSRFVRTSWQLLVLSAGCGFVTVIGFVAAYLLCIVVGSWNPAETAPTDVAQSAKAGIVSRVFQGSLFFLISAAAGGLASSTSAGLWLYREWRLRQGRGAAKVATGNALPATDAGIGDGRMHRGRRAASDMRFFWCTTACGPMIVALMLGLFLNSLSGPSMPVAPEQVLWLALNVYYGGSFAAAVAAALMLTLVYDRGRRSAWLAALCVGLHAGAMLLVLFVPASTDGEAGAIVFPMLLGGLVGALSAAICTAFWFPDRRGLVPSDVTAEAGMNGWALVRPLIVAGFIAPLAAALAYGLFVGLVPSAGTSPDSTFIGRLRSFDPWTWAIAYRVWAVVALQALVLRHLLPMAHVPTSLAMGITVVLAFLFSGGVGHSLDDYVMSGSTVVSFSSFLEFALPGLVAALAALYFIDLERPRRAVEAGNAAA